MQKTLIAAVFLFVGLMTACLSFQSCGAPATAPTTPTPTPTPSTPSSPTTISLTSLDAWAIRTAPNGNLWVLDYTGNQLAQVTAAGAVAISAITTFNGSNTFNSPQGLAVDSSGNVYVADYVNKQVELFNSSGTWQETFASTQLSGSFDEGIAVNSAGTTVYVEDDGTFTYLAFSVAAGTPPVLTYQSAANVGVGAPGGLNYPDGASFDGNGNLWVSDHTNGRVVEYNAAGVYQTAVTLKGVSPYTVDVAVDHSGNIFATENHNNTLQEFNAAGQWLYTVTGVVSNPKGLALDPTGTYLYVADTGNSRIIRYKIH